ncbi:hypothetical protein [Nocardia goodfellowii]|uniref:Uncharacterized protein n=1 Tax=Nocardia goodfellowii TaxID=882446 RepID=A0ABS4QJG5_9NOCA|nr:hypothetical protein [Nocardia goodfellowii]MBP2191851.1 hypothetical protein [Nocardia goodfellowii]
MIRTTEWTMTSDITPETAYRSTGEGARMWRLSWLPDRLLTREQARAGMELDEILSDMDSVHSRIAQARAADCAAELGLLWEQAVIMLSKRMIARLRFQPEEPPVTERYRHRPHLVG